MKILTSTLEGSYEYRLRQQGRVFGVDSSLRSNFIKISGLTNPVVFHPFPKIFTPRLCLDQPKMEDSSGFFSIQSDKANREFMDAPIADSIDFSEQFIKRIQGGIRRNEWLYWVIKRRGSGEMIGTICLWNFSEDKFMAEVGYELNSNFKKKGFMSESLAAIISFGFKDINLKIIEAYTHNKNQASIRLLEKYGFKYNHTINQVHAENGLPFQMIVYQLASTQNENS